MKLKLINNIIDEPCFVHIYKNKIVKYEGLYPLTRSDLLDAKFKIEDFNSYFESEVLDDYDRKSYGLNATHLLLCNPFELHVQHKALIKANKIQSLYIKWYQNQFWFQKINLAESTVKQFVSAIVGGVVGLILGYMIGITNQNNIDSQKPTINPTTPPITPPKKQEIKSDSVIQSKRDTISPLKDSIPK